jgi:hypothetical protein
MVLVRSASGRRYGTSRPGDFDLPLESSPVDPRTTLPDSQRKFVDTILPDGTVFRDWQEPPLSEGLTPEPPTDADLEELAIGESIQLLPQFDETEHWTGPIGPRKRP